MAVGNRDRVGPRNCAVLLVDLQNDFCHPNGAWKNAGIDPDLAKRIEAIQRFLPEARSQGVPVLFVRTVYNSWTISPSIQSWWQKMGMQGLCMEGSWGADFYQLAPQQNDRAVTKYRPSGFMETDLDLTLRAKEVETVLLAGVGVWGGCFDTARDAIAKSYDVMLVEDCIAGGTPEERSVLMDIFRRYHSEVVSSRALVKAWKQAK